VPEQPGEFVMQRVTLLRDQWVRRWFFRNDSRGRMLFAMTFQAESYGLSPAAYAESNMRSRCFGAYQYRMPGRQQAQLRHSLQGVGALHSIAIIDTFVTARQRVVLMLKSHIAETFELFPVSIRPPAQLRTRTLFRCEAAFQGEFNQLCQR